MTKLAALYPDKAPSTLEKGVLALLHACAVVSAAWLLFGGGIEVVSRWIGLDPTLGSRLRRGLLLAAAAVYFLRTLVRHRPRHSLL